MCETISSSDPDQTATTKAKRREPINGPIQLVVNVAFYFAFIVRLFVVSVVAAAAAYSILLLFIYAILNNAQQFQKIRRCLLTFSLFFSSVHIDLLAYYLLDGASWRWTLE